MMHLTKAAAEGKVIDVISALTAGTNINVAEPGNLTALIYAIDNGHEQVVEVLLEHPHIDVHVITNEGHHNPLTLALYKGHFSIAHALLDFKDEHGNIIINVNHRSAYGNALSIVASRSNLAMFDKLLSIRGIAVNNIDQFGNPVLISAIFGGNLQIVQRLLIHSDIHLHLAAGSNIFPLQCAAKYNKSLILHELLQSFRDKINTNDPFGMTALHYAAENGNVAIVRTLVELPDIEINAVDVDERTPLMLAAAKGNTNVVPYLLQSKKININAIDIYGNNACILAKAGNHNAVVNLLRNEARFNLNNPDAALVWAAQHGNVDQVSKFIADRELSPFIDEVDLCLCTALRRAAEQNHMEVARMLVKLPKLDINQLDVDDDTVLNYVAANGKMKFLDLLLTVSGIDLNYRDGKALFSALNNNQWLAVIRLLQAPTIETGFVDINGNTPLMLAIEKNILPVINELLAIPGNNINFINAFGDTALTKAVRMGNVYIVDRLLRVPGIDLNFIDQHGNTALIYAVKFGNLPVVVCLLRAPGLDINIPDRAGQTALDIAAKFGSLLIINALLDKHLYEKHSYKSLRAALVSASFRFDPFDNNNVRIINLLLAKYTFDLQNVKNRKIINHALGLLRIKNLSEEFALIIYRQFPHGINNLPQTVKAEFKLEFDYAKRIFGELKVTLSRLSHKIGILDVLEKIVDYHGGPMLGYAYKQLSTCPRSQSAQGEAVVAPYVKNDVGPDLCKPLTRHPGQMLTY